MLKKNLSPQEIEARLELKEAREKHGISCSRCKCTNNHYWYQNLWRWQCKSCGKTISLKSGTAMMHSKIEVHKWIEAAKTICSHNGKLSALKLQEKLNMNRYESTWYMFHRIRQSMGKYIGNGSNPNTFLFSKAVAENRIDRYTRLKNLHRSLIEVTQNANSSEMHVTMHSINYDWLEELTLTEFLNDKSRCSLKQIAARRAKPRTPMPDYYQPKLLDLDWSYSVIHKLELIHKRVTKRYTSNYLDEFIFCNLKMPATDFLCFK